MPSGFSSLSPTPILAGTAHTLSGTFQGATPAGNWYLYLYFNDGGQAGTATIGSWGMSISTQLTTPIIDWTAPAAITYGTGAG